MLARARLEFRYGDAKTAQMIAELLEIDNRAVPRKLKLTTRREGGSAVTYVEHEKLNTLSATIDDLLFSERLMEELIADVGHKPR